MSTCRLVCAFALVASSLSCFGSAPLAAANKRLLLIVPNVNLNRGDRQRAKLFQSWGYDVSLLPQNSSQTAVYDAADNNDVVFISAACNPQQIGEKFHANPIGVVTDHYGVSTQLGLAKQVARLALTSPATINSSAHAITAGFPVNQPLPDLVGNRAIFVAERPARDAIALSSFEGHSHFLLVEKSSRLANGAFAPGRRALIGHLSIDQMNRDVATILERSIAWAAEPVAYEYFVTVQGNDANSGRTPKQAFRTVMQAARVASADDTVYVGAGTYRGDVDVVNGGRRGHPLRFVADTSGQRTESATGAITLFGGNRRSSTVIAVNARRDVRFDGFTVRQGALLASFVDSHRCVLENCQLLTAIDDAVLCQASELLLKGTTIRAARDNGVVVDNSGRLNLLDSHIERSRNSGLLVLRGSADVKSCVLERNRNGVRVDRESSLQLSDTLVVGNRYGVFNSEQQANLTLTRSDLRDSLVRGLHISGPKSVALVDRCRVIGSRNDGVYLREVQVALTDCLIHHNKGDGVEIDKAEVAITNLTVAYNGREGIRLNASSGFLLNTISAFNVRAGLLLSASTRLRRDHNLLHGNRVDYSGGDPSEHDVDDDPEFINGPEGNLLLSFHSPAIDSGYRVKDKFDLEGLERPLGNAFDIGCYEHPDARRVRVFEWKEVR